MFMAPQDYFSLCFSTILDVLAVQWSIQIAKGSVRILNHYIDEIFGKDLNSGKKESSGDFSLNFFMILFCQIISTC